MSGQWRLKYGDRELSAAILQTRQISMRGLQMDDSVRVTM